MPLTLRGDGSVGGATFTPTGVVLPYAGTTEPTGWLFCYGQAVSRTTYADLFTALGTTYGAGDGSTTFNLPDMRGRVAAGRDNMGGSAASRLTTTVLDKTSEGGVGGAQTHTLTGAQSGTSAHPHSHNISASSGGMSANSSHSHTNPYGGSFLGTGTGASNANWVGTGASFQYNRSTDGTNTDHTHTVTISGGVTNSTEANASAAHNNTQPTIVLNYIIKAA